MKKIILLYLALLMVFQSTYVCAGDFMDVTKDQTYYNAVIKLVALGILDGTGDMFRAEEPMTRAELAEAVAKCMGVSKLGVEQAQTKFKDIAADTSLSGIVSVIADMGIMKGYHDGTFRPDTPVSYSEFSIVVVRMLGYEQVAENSSYSEVVSNLGLLSGIGQIPVGEFPRGTAAIMLARAVDAQILIPSMEMGATRYRAYTGRTVLSEYLSVYQAQGKVIAVGETAINQDALRQVGTINISGILFYTDKMPMDEYIGISVRVYYKQGRGEEDKHILFVQEQALQPAVITIRAEDMAGMKDNVLAYYEGTSLHKAVISGKADVIYNGESVTVYDEEDFTFQNGFLRLIDDDGDNLYETVVISRYDTVVIDTVNPTLGVITDKYNSTGVISLPDNASRLTVHRDNKQIELSGLNEWDVAALYRTKDRSKARIIVSYQTVQGAITEVSDETITVNGIPYKKSPYYKAHQRKEHIGKSAKLYLDAETLVATIQYTAGEDLYGYLIEMSRPKGISPLVELKILTSGNIMQQYALAASVELNGAAVRQSAIRQRLTELVCLEDGSGNLYARRQPIRYRLNEDRQITFLDTADTTQDTDDENRLIQEYNQTMNYRMRAAMFYDSSGKGRFWIDDSTYIIRAVNQENVPAHRDSAQDRYYKFITDVSSIGDFTNRRFEAYNINEGGLASMVVMFTDTTPDTAALMSDSPLAMVDKITDAINDEGNPAKKIYLHQNGASVSYWLNDVSLAYKSAARLYEKGDIIRYNLEGSAISVIALQYDFSSDKMYTIDGKEMQAWYTGTVGGGTFTAMGRVYSLDNAGIRISVERDAENKPVFHTDDLLTFQIAGHGISCYDLVNDRVRKADATDIITHVGIPGKATPVFVKLISGTVSEVFVYVNQ